MANHSDGVWKAVGTSVMCNGVTVAKAQRSGGFEHKFPRDQPEANAQLIAAAPELLRECKFALEMLQKETRSWVLASVGYANMTYRLAEVIKKASGVHVE